MCTGMEQLTGESWAQSTVERIYTNITDERRRQGISANELAQRCAEHGLPIPRAVISKMDNHKRANITIPELLVIARALQVAPSHLIYSPRSSELVAYLPGEYMSTTEAAGRLIHDDRPALRLFHTAQQVKNSVRATEALFSNLVRDVTAHARNSSTLRERIAQELALERERVRRQLSDLDEGDLEVSDDEVDASLSPAAQTAREVLKSLEEE